MNSPKVIDTTKSIRELFDEYKGKPYTDWIQDYKERCDQVKKLQGEPEKEYTESVLEDIWKTKHNGVTNVGQLGILSKNEFEKLLPILPGITLQIVEDPSPETLEKIEHWAKSEKNKGNFKTIKWGVINRVFAAANPDSYSPFLDKDAVIKFIQHLNNQYDLNININKKDNWCQLNMVLMKALKSQGLDNEDIYYINTFTWPLYDELEKLNRNPTKESNAMKSIRKLFDEYKREPRIDWIEKYEIRCNQVEKLQGEPLEAYTRPVLEDIWKKSHNGVSKVSPGFLSHEEFEKLLPSLPEITLQIVKDSSPETRTKIEHWAKLEKEKGNFKSHKRGVINRVFAAANPDSYSTILNRKRVIKFIQWLNKYYDLNIKINKKDNWCELNKELMKALKSQGLDNEDVYYVNTFAWQLYSGKLTGDNDMVFEEDDDDDEDEEIVDKPTGKNVIYYGPPGTGKTYKLQTLLEECYTEKGVIPDERLWLIAQIEKLSWFQIIALILLESDRHLKVAEIMEHEYYKIKEESNEHAQKNLHATAWATLQSHTIKESETVKLTNRSGPQVFDKTESGSKWYIVPGADEQLEDLKSLQSDLLAGPKEIEKIERFEFVTFHQSYGYEEFIEGLRPKLDNDNETEISYEIKPGIFRKICKKAKNDPDNKYAIFIDEINRGNISKIFGELITLIETDKRTGANYALPVTLPYSNESFSVPQNLDIIGTMNTADRSLTHIDVALRRRFEFEELSTDYSLISNNMQGINLRRMLYAMNQRIELLLDRDHILGHAALMNISSLDDLIQVFKTKFIPQLEEYFFEDREKIDQVLGSNEFFQERKKVHETWLGKIDDEYTAKSFKFNTDKLNDISQYQSIYTNPNLKDSDFAECDKPGSES